MSPIRAIEKSLTLSKYESQRHLAGTKNPDISVLAVDPGAMGGTGLLRESPAALRFAAKRVLAPISVLTSALSPNGNLCTLKKNQRKTF